MGLKKFTHGVDLALSTVWLVLGVKALLANQELGTAHLGLALVFLKFAVSTDSLPSAPKV